MLKFKVNSLDDVDENARAFYEETDDGFQLSVEGVASQSDYDDVMRKLRTSERANKKLRPFQELNLSVEEIKGLQSRVEDLSEQLKTAGGKDADKVREEMRKHFQEQYGGELKELRGQLTELQQENDSAKSQLRAREVTKEAREFAAKKLGVTEKWLDIIVDERVEAGKIGRNEDGELVMMQGGEVRTDKTGAEVLFEDFLSGEIKDRPELTGENTGADARGSRRGVAGKRVVETDDPLALGRAADAINAGKAALR